MLESGDSLLLYTDGVTEAQFKEGKNKLYGETRLKETFCRSAQKSGKEIIEDIIRDLDAFSYDDDVTLLVIKRL